MAVTPASSGCCAGKLRGKHQILWGEGMPLLQVNIDRHGKVVFAPDELTRALAGLAPGAPVVAMIHGYKYAPGRPGACPHDHILSLTPPRDCWKAVSWPRHMGFGRGRRREGLALAIGWQATGSVWGAYARAGRAGAALGGVIGEIATRTGRPVDLLGHSLGARVALAATEAAGAGEIGRAVLMAGAEFTRNARRAARSEAGKAAEFFNITSAENALFDAMLRAALGTGARVLGAGLRDAPDNWLDLRIDADHTRAALARRGYRIPAPKLKVCHWSTYLRPGLFRLYADLVRRRETLAIADLRRAMAEAGPARSSRLRAHPAVNGPLPLRPGSPS